MLSKKDYQDYLDQIVELERRMSSIYKNCSENLEDENIKRPCSGLSVAEEKHAVMVQELVDLLTS
jgi:rubrerythrin